MIKTALSLALVALPAAAGMQVTATIPVGNSPQGAALSPDGSRLYVPLYGDDALAVIDTARSAVIARIPVLPGPIDVKLGPTGARAYVGYDYEKGTRAVTVIDTKTMAVVTNVKTTTASYAGSAPLVVSPDGTRVYAGQYPVGPLSVIDASSNVEIATAPLPAWYDNSAAITPDGKTIFFAMFDTPMAVYDTASNSFTMSGAASVTLGVDMAPDGSHFYVGAWRSGWIYDVDTASRRVRSSIATGSSTAWLAISGDGSRLAAADDQGHSIYLIDTATDTVVETLPIAQAVEGLALDQSGARLWSVNDTSNGTVTLWSHGVAAPVLLTTPAALDSHALFGGAASAGAQVVHVYDGGRLVADVTPASDGSFRFDGLAAPRALADGPHALSFVTVIDGFQSAPAQFSFVLWTQAPAVVIVAPAAAASQPAAAQPFAWTVAGGYLPPAGVSITSLTLSFDGVVLYRGAPAAAPAALDLTLQAPGAHAVSLGATDSLGNATAAAVTTTFQYAPGLATDIALTVALLGPLAGECPAGEDADAEVQEGGRRFDCDKLQRLLRELERVQRLLARDDAGEDRDESAHQIQRALWKYLTNLGRYQRQQLVPASIAGVLAADVRFLLDQYGGPPREEAEEGRDRPR